MNSFLRFIPAKGHIAVLAISIFVQANSCSAYSRADAYITQYAPIAQSLSQKTGIPASVILGIALIESGHGSSKNCLMLKNHFGVKGNNYLPQNGIPYYSVYRSYSCDEASFGHFCTIIKRKKYYSRLRGNNNYDLWLEAINNGYYSSAGIIWVNKIRNAIRMHHLEKFDRQIQRLSFSPKMNWLHS